MTMCDRQITQNSAKLIRFTPTHPHLQPDYIYIYIEEWKQQHYIYMYINVDVFTIYLILWRRVKLIGVDE